MQRITEFTDAPRQKISVQTEDNETFDIIIAFLEQQSKWVFSLKYNDFILNNHALVYAENILRRYKNILPFGISIITEDGQDPFLFDDFSSGRAEFYVLNSEDVVEFEAKIYEVD